MRKKLSLLFFMTSIVLATVQYNFKVDGTAGFLLVTLAVLFFLASIAAGKMLKEFLGALAEFFL